jgi:hypothetical protein
MYLYFQNESVKSFISLSVNLLKFYFEKEIHVNICQNNSKQLMFNNMIQSSNCGQKSGLMVSKHDSLMEGYGFESNPMLDGNCVKAMTGMIPALKPGSLIN